MFFCLLYFRSYTRKSGSAYLTLRLVFTPLKGDRALMKHTVVLVLSDSITPQNYVPIRKCGFAVFLCEWLCILVISPTRHYSARPMAQVRKPKCAQEEPKEPRAPSRILSLSSEGFQEMVGIVAGRTTHGKNGLITRAYCFSDILVIDAVNFENLSSNSLLAVSETPGNNCLNYRANIKVRTSKRMCWRVKEFSLLWPLICQKLIVTSTWNFRVINALS